MNLSAILNSDVCVRMMLTLGHFLWQATAIALAALGVAWMLRRSSANARYLVLLAALVLMATCPPVTFLLVGGPAESAPIGVPPSLSERPLPEAAPLATPVAASPAVPAIAEAAPAQAGLAVGIDLPAAAAATPEPSTSIAPPSQFWAGWEKLAPHLTLAYLAGVGLMLLRLLVGLHGGGRLRHTSQPVADGNLLATLSRQARRIGLRFAPAAAWCRRVATPTVVGIFRPVILLPAALMSGLSAEQIEGILLHELAHIRRHDYLVNLVQRVIEAYLFFHPAVWWVSRRIRLERENCCDDVAVAVGGRPASYAALLLDLAEKSLAMPARQRGNLVALGATDRPGGLRQRVHRLLGVSSHEGLRLRRSWPLALVAVITLGLAIVLGCLGDKAPAGPAAPAPTVPVPAGPAEKLMPGSGIKDLRPYLWGGEILALMEATEDPRPETLEGALRLVASQEFKVIEFFGDNKTDQPARVTYTYDSAAEAPIAKGQRVLWLAGNMIDAGEVLGGRNHRVQWGIKAYPDTPQNRTAALPEIRAALADEMAGRVIKRPEQKTMVLPGSRVPLGTALETKGAVVALCQALEGSFVAARPRDEYGRLLLLFYSQKFKVVQVLAGGAAAKEVAVGHLPLTLTPVYLGNERAITKGETVLWIARPTDKADPWYAADHWRGLKALLDTPENRKALGVAPAAGAVKGLEVTIEPQQRKYVLGQPMPVKWTIRNVGTTDQAIVWYNTVYSPISFEAGPKGQPTTRRWHRGPVPMKETPDPPAPIVLKPGEAKSEQIDLAQCTYIVHGRVAKTLAPGTWVVVGMYDPRSAPNRLKNFMEPGGGLGHVVAERIDSAAVEIEIVAAELPGSKVSLDKALAEKGRLIVLCQALEDGIGVSREEGVEEVSQKYKVVQVLAGKSAQKELRIGYTRFENRGERRIMKGDQVIWILRPDQGDYLDWPERWWGVKAYADTPEKRKALGVAPAGAGAGDLPGSGATVEQALAEKGRVVALCEAAEDGTELSRELGTALVIQEFKVLEMLVPRQATEPNRKAEIRYMRRVVFVDGVPQSERRIAKGERLLWIARPAPDNPVDGLFAWEGLKALADTPENRKALGVAPAAAGEDEAVRSLVRRAIIREVLRVPEQTGSGQSPTRLDNSALLKLSGQDKDLAVFRRDHGDWDKAVAALVAEKKVWALAALLDHENVDAKIDAARGLVELADPRTAPAMLAAAKANHYPVRGSEGATLHMIYRQTLKQGLAKATGLELTPRGLTLTEYPRPGRERTITSEEHPERFGEEVDFAKVEAWLMAKYLPADGAADAAKACAERIKAVLPAGWSVEVKESGHTGRVVVARERPVELVVNSPVAPAPMKKTAALTVEVHLLPWVSPEDRETMVRETSAAWQDWNTAHPNYSPVEMPDLSPYSPPTHFDAERSLRIECEFLDKSRYEWPSKETADECRAVLRVIKGLYRDFAAEPAPAVPNAPPPAPAPAAQAPGPFTVQERKQLLLAAMQAGPVDVPAVRRALVDVGNVEALFAKGPLPEEPDRTQLPPGTNVQSWSGRPFLTARVGLDRTERGAAPQEWEDQLLKWSREGFQLRSVDLAIAPTDQVRAERDRLLTEADAAIRKGLLELSKAFPQLAVTNQGPLAEQLAGKHDPGVVSINASRNEGGKGGSSTPVAERDRYTILVVIRPLHFGGPLPQLVMSQLEYDNLALMGQVHYSAVDPKLDAAIKKLIGDALVPLKELNRKTGESQANGVPVDANPPAARPVALSLEETREMLKKELTVAQLRQRLGEPVAGGEGSWGNLMYPLPGGKWLFFWYKGPYITEASYDKEEIVGVAPKTHKLLVEQRSVGGQISSYLEMDGREFAGLADLEKHVRSLPKGALVEYQVSDVTKGGLHPLQTGQGIEELRRICREAGVILLFYLGG